MSNPSRNPKLWREWVAAIQEGGKGLTTWEEEFIESIATKLEQYGDDTFLSDRQVEQLERIYADRT